MNSTAQETTFGTRLRHRRMECHLRQVDLAGSLMSRKTTSVGGSRAILST